MPHAEEVKKNSIVWKMIKVFGRTLFPIFNIFYINHHLKLCEKTLHKELKNSKGEYNAPYDWFPKQKRKNILWGLGSLLPLLVAILLSYVILSSNPIFSRGIKAANAQISFSKALKGFGIKDAIKKLEIANQYDPTFYQDIRISLYLVFGGLFTSMIIGSILVYRHPLLIDTNRLKKELERSGFIRPEDNHVVFATEVGFLIDITGSVSREIADSDRIWTSLNVRVNRDVAENPEKRSLVFFKKAFELKNGDEYGFDKIPKEK